MKLGRTQVLSVAGSGNNVISVPRRPYPYVLKGGSVLVTTGIGVGNRFPTFGLNFGPTIGVVLQMACFISVAPPAADTGSLDFHEGIVQGGWVPGGGCAVCLPTEGFYVPNEAFLQVILSGFSSDILSQAFLLVRDVLDDPLSPAPRSAK